MASRIAAPSAQPDERHRDHHGGQKRHMPQRMLQCLLQDDIPVRRTESKFAGDDGNRRSISQPRYQDNRQDQENDQLQSLGAHQKIAAIAVLA